MAEALGIDLLRNSEKGLLCRFWFPSKHAEPLEGRARCGVGGLVWRLFCGEGWVWHDTKALVYMHLGGGYPSRRYMQRCLDRWSKGRREPAARPRNRIPARTAPSATTS